MRLFRLFQFVVALVVLASSQGVVLAQEAYYASDDSRLVDRVNAQDAKIQELESLLQNQSTFRPVSTMLGDAAGAGDGWTDTHTEKWKHKWGGRVMLDWVNWADQQGTLAPVGGQNYVEFRRLRFFCSGKGYGVFDYKLQVDFEPEGAKDSLGNQDGAV